MRNFLLTAALALLPLAGRAWTPEAAQLLARDASQHLPPALLAMVGHFPDAFNDGFSKAKPAAGRAALEAQLAAQGAKLAGMMQQVGNLADFSREWGAYLRLALEACDPFLGAPLTPDAARLDYDNYFVKTSRKVKRALYVGDWVLGEDEKALLARIAQRAAGEAAQVRAAYQPDGSRRSALEFDDRSNVFGATSLAWNHAASGAATLATRCWQRGGGDLSGSPFLPRPAAASAPRSAPAPGLKPGSFENPD